MSRYLLPEDRSYFSCEPASPSGAYSQEMLNQDWHTTPSSRSSTEPCAAPAFTAPTDGAELAHCQQDNSLSRQNKSHLGWDGSSGNDISNINHEFEMCQGQDSCKIFQPVGHSAVSEDQRCPVPSWNFQILRNRELGGKMLGVVASESKDSTSASDFGASNEYTGGMLDDACGKPAASASNTNHTDIMDLDGALDELGMLSTVTNSRMQYLLETGGQASLPKSLQRLHSKSKSSPNLTSSRHLAGYHIMQLNKNFVTSLIDTLPCPAASSAGLFDKSPRKSIPSQLGCINPNIGEETSTCHRFDSHFSRKHRYRYMYRLSRSPYKNPRRFCNSLHESDFVPEYFSSGDNSLKTSALSSSTPSLEPSADSQASELTSCQQSLKSKSNTASPVKPNADMRLTRSLSAEDLTSVSRRLEQEMNTKCRESSSTEQSLDIMTSQMTDLHMS